MSDVFRFCLLSFIFVGCAVSPTGVSSSYGTQDHDWLVKLSTYRVRDETILKSQDKVALQYDDLHDLLIKEVDPDEILDLIDELGVSPALKKNELNQLQQMGATSSLLQKLGQAAIAMRIPEKSNDHPIAETRLDPPTFHTNLKTKNDEKSKTPSLEIKSFPLSSQSSELITPTSKPKARLSHPSRLSSEYRSNTASSDSFSRR